MIGAIIQARMSSTRLPGKVLREICGQPLLAYLIKRVKLSKKIECIVLATSSDREDDPIAACASLLGVHVYRGSLENVLDRFYQAAQTHKIEHAVRITGDCPVIDPAICDRLIERYQGSKADYAGLSPAFAEGLDCEVISFPALVQANRDSKNRSDKEHVTLYVRNHPDIFRMTQLENQEDESRYRVTVDNAEDFDVVSGIITHFMEKTGDFTALWPQIRIFLDKHPDLLKKNAHIERNAGLKRSLMADGTATGPGGMCS